MYGTVKYTDDTSDSLSETGVEDKKKNGRIKHVPYSLDLAPYDFGFFPQLKSDLHGKRFSDLDELRTETDHMVWYLRKMGSSTQEMPITPRRVF